MKRILLIVVLVAIALGLMAFTRPLGPNAPAEPEVVQEGLVALPDLGVAIALPSGLGGLVVGTSTAPVVGTVLAVAVPPASGTNGVACDLGVYYTVPKSAVVAGTAGWDEARLKAAATGTDTVPPQAKEFADFYFVFEPAQAACSTDPSQQAIEMALRETLWRAVSTAVLLPREQAQQTE